MVLNGSDYIIFIDVTTPVTALSGNPTYYRPVVCGKSNGFNGEVESISTRNKCDDGWENSLAGYGSWGMSLDGYAISMRNSEKLIKANFEEVSQLFLNKTHFWAMLADADSNIIRQGVVRISSYAETTNMDDPYSFNLSLTGIGKPIITSDINPPIPELGGVYYGVSGSIPTTPSQVKALVLLGNGILSWSFETGLNRTFTIALPTGFTLVSVEDQDSEEDITDAFDTISIINVDGVNYTTRTMQNAINFSSSHTFNVIISNG